MCNYDFETVLEELECPCCHSIGVKEKGGDTYMCPVCDYEGDIYDDAIVERPDFSDYLAYKECPNCGKIGTFEVAVEDDDYYWCTNCGHDGSIQDDMDAQNYMWDEALCGYSEDEKGEVF